MGRLAGYQKQYLKGLAHGMKPLILIGWKGVTPALIKALDEALERHELVKVKFLDVKEKELKKKAIDLLRSETASELVGSIGHMALFFRQQIDPEKMKIDIARVNATSH